MDSITPPPAPDDAQIERLLRELVAEHIDDDGFTSRTLAALPKRNPLRRTLVLAGAIACGSAIVIPMAGPDAWIPLQSAMARAATALDQQPAWSAYVSLSFGLLVVALTTFKVLVRTR